MQITEQETSNRANKIIEDSVGGVLYRRVCRALTDYEQRPDEDNARAMRQLPLDPQAGTAYQRHVWETIRHIPPGQTRSYAEVARMTGRPGAARAVGSAMRSNPFFILVPCHRVIRSDKTLGGWSSLLPDGKSRLLHHENALGNRTGTAAAHFA